MEQKIQVIMFEQHLTNAGSYVQQHHFAEVYNDKNVGKQFPFAKENHEIQKTYIRHQNLI